MGRKGLERLWFATGLFSLYAALNFWSITQRWHVTLPLAIKVDESTINTYAASILAILIAGTALAVFAAVAISYARRQTAQNGSLRLPVLAWLEIKNTRPLRVYRAVAVALLLIVPIAAQIHFADKFLHGTASCGVQQYTGWALLDPSSIVYLGSRTCEYDGVTYFAFVEAVFLLAFATVTILVALGAIFTIFRR